MCQRTLPKLVGLEGDMFFTNRWNYRVEGGIGDEEFPEMTRLGEKEVGCVGPGATAIQAVPERAKCAKELYISQLAPSKVYTRG